MNAPRKPDDLPLMPSGCWAVPLGVMAVLVLADVEPLADGKLPWWVAFVGALFLAGAVEQLWGVVQARRRGRDKAMFGGMVLLACAVAWLSTYFSAL